MIDYKADAMFWQRFLKCAGFYTDDIDGDFGKLAQVNRRRLDSTYPRISDRTLPVRHEQLASIISADPPGHNT